MVAEALTLSSLNGEVVTESYKMLDAKMFLIKTLVQIAVIVSGVHGKWRNKQANQGS